MNRLSASFILFFLLLIPLSSFAMDISDECTHGVTNLTTGSGVWSGTQCTLEKLLQLGNDQRLSAVERTDALHSALVLLANKISNIKGIANTQAAASLGSECFVPKYDLYLGRSDVQTNGEVSKLQLWLKDQGVFPDAQGTGYYGEKTAAAVMKWQKAHGMDFVTLKSGVGKQTRAKMQEACKGATPDSLEQNSSSYGLTVRFENVGGAKVAVAEFSGKFDVGDSRINWPKAYIDFGNNGSIETKKLVCPGANCLFEARYLYPKAGTYTVSLHIIKDYKKVVLATTQVVVPQDACPVSDDMPYIAAIAPASGALGTEADIWGCNLAGYEGDLYASFQKDGKSWVLGDNRSTRSSTSLIHVTVKEPCLTGQAYIPPGDESGIPKACPYTPMTPGVYSVSVSPWGKKSNSVNFTVTQ